MAADTSAASTEEQARVTAMSATDASTAERRGKEEEEEEEGEDDDVLFEAKPLSPFPTLAKKEETSRAERGKGADEATSSTTSSTSPTTSHVRFDHALGQLDDDEDDAIVLSEEIELADLGEDDQVALRKIADQEGKGNVWSATFNFINSIIGAGIIALPYAFLQGGLIMSILLLVGLTIIVDWTVRLLLLSSKITGQTTYPTVVAAAFGRPGWIAVSLFQWLFAFGAICAYIVIIGDNLPVVLYYFWPALQDGTANGLLTFLAHRSTIMLLSTLCIILPLSLVKDIAKLAATSTIAFLTVLYIVAVVVWEWLALDAAPRGEASPWTWANGGWLRAVGVISCAFVCHHNTFLIYSSLRKPTLKRFATVTHMSTLTSLPLSMLMALAGYMTFVEKTRANIFLNLPLSLPVTLARFAFSVNMFTTIPLEVFVAREVMEQYFFSDKDDFIVPQQREVERQRRQRALTTESLYGIDGSEFRLVDSQAGSVEDVASSSSSMASLPFEADNSPATTTVGSEEGLRPRSRAGPRSTSPSKASDAVNDQEAAPQPRVLTPRGVSMEEGRLPPASASSNGVMESAKQHFIAHRHFWFTFLLILVALIIATSTCDVGPLLEITGGICATALAYILPPAVYLHVSRVNPWTWQKLPHLLCLAGGILVLFGAGGTSLVDFFTASSSRQCNVAAPT